MPDFTHTKTYVRYLIEIVVIVAGITLSFLVDEYREDKREKEEYKIYLSKLKSDLLLDSLMTDFTKNRRKAQYVGAVQLYNELYNNHPIKDDSVFVHLAANVLRTTPITQSNFTFREILSSGNLRLIEDDSVRLGLIVYYNMPQVAVWNNTIDERNHKALHLVVKHLPLEIYFLSDSLFAGREINYAWTKQELIKNLKNEPDFEGLLKNTIRTIEKLAEIEMELLEINRGIINRINMVLEEG